MKITGTMAEMAWQTTHVAETVKMPVSFMPYSNQGLLEWFLWHVTLCLTEPYDMFMMCS